MSQFVVAPSVCYIDTILMPLLLVHFTLDYKLSILVERAVVGVFHQFWQAQLGRAADV